MINLVLRFWIRKVFAVVIEDDVVLAEVRVVLDRLVW